MLDDNRQATAMQLGGSGAAIAAALRQMCLIPGQGREGVSWFDFMISDD
jgi:hypothetical protein